MQLTDPGAISGTNCTALAALPITATRSPVRSWSWSQRAEWNIVPVNVVEPGDVGEVEVAEHPDRADEHVELVLVAVVGGDVPRARRRRPSAPR